MNEDPDWEQPIAFLDCTCDHDKQDHSWGCCEVEGCPCEGGWEE